MGRRDIPVDVYTKRRNEALANPRTPRQHAEVARLNALVTNANKDSVQAVHDHFETLKDGDMNEIHSEYNRCRDARFGPNLTAALEEIRRSQKPAWVMP
jgi:hypothetical protein